MATAFVIRITEKQEGYDLVEIGRNLLTIMCARLCRMIFHADPHPGNL